jgi:protein-S-isoprenylcysteine O-methyltransferase Ste14
MATGATIKSIYWVSYISNEEMPVSNALKVSVFEIFFSSTNSILSLTKSPSNSVTAILLLLGYTFGWYFEIAAERERKKFKDNPQNKGKLFTKGLFRFARHINYGAYLLRKSSQAMVCGGWKWGLTVATYHFLDFAKRGIPVLDVYCEKRVRVSEAVITDKRS